MLVVEFRGPPDLFNPGFLAVDDDLSLTEPASNMVLMNTCPSWKMGEMMVSSENVSCSNRRSSPPVSAFTPIKAFAVIVMIIRRPWHSTRIGDA